MPKYERENLRRTASRPFRFDQKSGGDEGKLISSQGKPLRDSAPPSEKAAVQVRERQAREGGPGAGRAKSLERQNPGEQRIANGVRTVGDGRTLRGSKARKPNRL